LSRTAFSTTRASLPVVDGVIVVVQNVVSSLFNSHLFDFHEGWIYVLGVGIAGGSALRANRTVRADQATSAASSTSPPTGA
jgi:O-antigen ligase